MWTFFGGSNKPTGKKEQECFYVLYYYMVDTTVYSTSYMGHEEERKRFGSRYCCAVCTRCYKFM